MLNFNDDFRNMTLEQLRSKNEKLREELKSLGEKAEENPSRFTSDNSRRVSDITDWIDRAEAPADDSGSIPDSQPGTYTKDGFGFLPSVSNSEQRNKDVAAGQFFQCVVAAASPPGQRIGQFESGRVYNSVLEQRSEGLDSQPSLGGFLTQTSFSEDIIGSLYSPDRLPGLVRKITLSGNVNKLEQPGVDETSRANGSRWGGIQSYYEGEGEEKTKSKPAFRKIEMGLVSV